MIWHIVFFMFFLTMNMPPISALSIISPNQANILRKKALRIKFNNCLNLSRLLIKRCTIELCHFKSNYGHSVIVNATNSFFFINIVTFLLGWLFLCFRREFAEEEDTLVCFEVVCSHFLEENSLAADRLFHDIQLKQAEQKGTSSHSSLSLESHSKHQEELPYSFDLFVCVAMISLFRSCLFDAEDELEALQAIQHRQKTLDVRQVLSLAEHLFTVYYQQLANAASVEIASYEVVD